MGFYVCICDIIPLFNGYIKYVHQKIYLFDFTTIHVYMCVFVHVYIYL